MKKAILYLQFSTIEQAREHTQKHYDCAKKYCAENDIELVRVFDEVSTKPPRERYYFDKALKVAMNYGEELTYFLVMDYSRISRNYFKFKEIEKELESVRIYIHPINREQFFSAEQFFDKLTAER